MGKLIAFADTTRRKAERPVDVGPPPDDVLSGATWLHKVLRLELWGVLQDDTLTDEERRNEVLRLARAVNQCTPNAEIHQAREAIGGEEKRTRGTRLAGQVQRAVPAGPRSLRTDAPRRKTSG